MVYNGDTDLIDKQYSEQTRETKDVRHIESIQKDTELSEMEQDKT